MTFNICIYTIFIHYQESCSILINSIIEKTQEMFSPDFKLIMVYIVTLCMLLCVGLV